MENHSFDTSETWSRTGVTIESGAAKFVNLDGRVAQGFRAGENLIYDATVTYKGATGGGGVRSHAKIYRYNGSANLADAKAGIANGMGADICRAPAKRPGCIRYDNRGMAKTNYNQRNNNRQYTNREC